MAKRNYGAYLLARTGETQEEIAARTRLNRVQIANYLVSRIKPRAANRVVLRKTYGVPDEAWDQSVEEGMAGAGDAPSPSAPPPGNRSDHSVGGRAQRLQRMVDELLESVSNDPAATPYEKVKVMAKAAATTAVLGKLTGESQEIGEGRILRLPAWRRIRDRMLEALKPWPDALRATVEALRELGE